MRIVSIAIDNVLKIKAAFIQVKKGAVVMVQGDNEMGKSTILDCIVMALKGGKVIPSEPIHKGANKGKIVMEIDGHEDEDPSKSIPPFTIIQSITPKGAYLSIKPNKALKGLTPRAFLDKIIGSVSFDPLEFINKDAKKQKDTLIEMLGIDTTEIDGEIKDMFDDRTESGRDLKAAEAVLSDMTRHLGVEETEEVSAVDLLNKMTAAVEHNNNIKSREKINNSLKASAVEIRDERMPECKKEIENLKAQLAKKEEQLSTLTQMFGDMRLDYKAEKAAIEELEEIETAPITAQIEAIEETNKKIRENNAYKLASDKVEKHTLAFGILDANLKEMREEREKLMQGANMPVKDLTFGEDSLLYKGLPLAQASDGKKLVIGLSISMELNPTLRVLRIKDGSLLGKKNLKLISDLVEDKGYQLWFESVNDLEGYEREGSVGIFIEEGQIIQVDGKKPKKKPAEKKKTVAKKVDPESGGVDKVIDGGSENDGEEDDW